MAAPPYGTAVSWAADALPPALCARLAGLFGLSSVPDTLDDVVAAADPATAADHPAVVEAFAVGPDAVGAAHEVETSAGRAAAPALGDALALAALAGGSGVVYSADPVTGAPVTVRLDAADDVADPAAAVVSLGAGPHVWDGETVTAETVRRSVVPHVHLFESRRTFWRYEAATPEPVVALGAGRADDVGRVLAGDPGSAAPAGGRFPVDCRAPAVARGTDGPARTAVADAARLDDGLATPTR